MGQSCPHRVGHRAGSNMFLEVALLFVTLLGLGYWWLCKKWAYWKENGIPGPTPSLPAGNFGAVMAMKVHLNDWLKDLYRQFPGEKFIGIYTFHAPVMVVNDPDMARQILVKDFNHFVDRDTEENMSRAFPGKTDAYWLEQMTIKTGEKWKDIRSTFSPIFTSGKMKAMMRFIDKVSDSLVGHLDKRTALTDGFELKDTMGKFSLDTLASCAFGVDGQSFEDKESVFVNNAARIFSNTKMDQFKIFGAMMLPGMAKFMRLMGMNSFKPKETMFFANIVTKTIQQRKASKERKEDLIDLMIDAMEGLKEEEQEENKDQYEADMKLAHKTNVKNLDEMSFIGTAMVFLVAGYDTTGMTLSWICYELAKNPDLQRRLQEEVDAAYEASGGKTPDYNDIQGFAFLDQLIQESLRLHTPIALQRCVTSAEYTMPGTNIKMKKGDTVFINSLGIHSDPEYFPNPSVFNPDNFSKEAKASRSPYTFLGFGQGPRACIGMRFAMLETKVALLKVFRQFSFERVGRTVEQATTDPGSQLGYAKEGLYVRVVRRTEE